MKTDYDKNIKINYLFLLVKNLNVTQGVWVLYLVSKGLSLFEIGLLEGIFHVTSFLMETPTGAVADIFGRKASRLVGIVLNIAASALLIITGGFWAYALSFVVLALSYNFESGANEAFVYDSLKLSGRQDDYMKIAGHNEVIFQGTHIISLIVGGLIGGIQFVYAFYLAIALGVVSLVIGLKFKEPVICQQAKMSLIPAMKQQYISCFSAVRENRRFLYLAIFASALSFGVTLSFYYLQAAWQQNQLTPLTIGLYLAVGAATSAVGAVFAHRIEKRFGETLIIKTAPFIISAGICGLFFLDLAIIPFSIMCFFEAVVFVATRDYINKIIPSEKRATLLSFESMIFSMLMIAIFPLFGLVSDSIGVGNTFLFLGALILIMGLVNLKKASSDKQKSKV